MKKLVLLLTIAFLCGSQAIARGQEKGGGAVLKIKGHYYLYDFVENGLEDSAVLAPDVPDKDNLVARLRQALRNDQALAKVIANKLYEIQSKNKMLDYLLRDFLRMYSFRFVNTELVKVPDLGPSPIIPVAGAELVQVAVRDDNQRAVWVDQNVWNQLSLTHKAGLYFHEAFYSIMRDGDSSYTRTLTAYIFSPQFQDVDSATLLGLLRTNYMPRVQIGYYNGEVVEDSQFDNWVASYSPEAFKKSLKALIAYFDKFSGLAEKRALDQVHRLKGDRRCRGFESMVVSLEPSGHLGMTPEKPILFINGSELERRTSAFFDGRAYSSYRRKFFSELLSNKGTYSCSKHESYWDFFYMSFNNRQVTLAKGPWTPFKNPEIDELHSRLSQFKKMAEISKETETYDSSTEKDQELEGLFKWIKDFDDPYYM